MTTTTTTTIAAEAVTTTMTKAAKRGGIRFPWTRAITAGAAVASFVAFWGVITFSSPPAGSQDPAAALAAATETSPASPGASPTASAGQSGPANAVSAAPVRTPVPRVATTRRSRGS